MFGLTRIDQAGQPWPSAQPLATAISTLGHSNVFNPSMAAKGSSWTIAYRALRPSRSKPFEAFLAESDTAQPSGWSIRSLTEQASSHGVAPVADPKLFTVGDALYATFNTGYSAVQNELYVMQVAPHPRPPQRCVMDGPRQQVEKNWAFFPLPNGDLGAIYQLAPYTELRLVKGFLGTSDSLVFRRTGAVLETHADNLTIGTPVLVEAGRLVLVAHEKFRVGRRRAYLGRLVEIPTDGPGARVPRIAPRRLVHSYRAMLPSTRRHNPNLISATYFSGLARSGGDLVLGYGINDKDFAIRAIEERHLWS